MRNAPTVKSIANVDFIIHLALTEDEARALKQITTYGPDEFIKWYYKHLGKHYMERNEKGIRSLFETINLELPKHLAKFDKVRKAWTNENVIK